MSTSKTYNEKDEKRSYLHISVAPSNVFNTQNTLFEKLYSVSFLYYEEVMVAV